MYSKFWTILLMICDLTLGYLIRQTGFTKFPSYNNVICPNQISVFFGVSLCRCSTKCIENPDCVTFFWNLDRTCFLYDVVLPDSIGCSPKNGTHYYVKSDIAHLTQTTVADSTTIEQTTQITTTVKQTTQPTTEATTTIEQTTLPTTIPTTQPLTPSCNTDWVLIGNGCYQFTPGGLKWWENARDECASLGGYLAEINSEEENGLLKTEAANQAGDHFVGGSDLLTEGNFVWLNTGTDVPLTTSSGFNDWSPGQPDNGGSASDQHCLMLQQSYAYAWNDVKCNVNRKFICEQEVIYS